MSRALDRIIWMPTFRCNLRCSYCMARNLPLDKHGEEVAPERWIEMFNSPDVEIGHISISGGEPTCYQGLSQVLEGASFRYGIDTNMMSHPSKWLVLNSAGVCERLTMANMSLHFHPQAAMAEKVFERMRWVTERVQAGRVTLGSTYVVTQKDPPGEFPLFCEMLAEKAPGVTAVRGNFGDVYMFRTLVPKWEGTAISCDAGENSCVVLPDGAVYRCLGHAYFSINQIGNLFRDGWSALMDGSPRCDHLLCTGCDKAKRQIVDGSGSPTQYLSEFRFRPPIVHLSEDEVV